MKNILKEIKNDIISKGDEPNVDNLDQYISQDKIFCILFYSKIIPDSSNLLSSLKILNTSDVLKLVICICEDNEEDYKASLSQINNISCLILKYESKSEDIKLIEDYIKDGKGELKPNYLNDIDIAKAMNDRYQIINFIFIKLHKENENERNETEFNNVVYEWSLIEKLIKDKKVKKMKKINYMI